jgi:uncharacterized protein YjiS (DUF1127 family)
MLRNDPFPTTLSCRPAATRPRPPSRWHARLAAAAAIVGLWRERSRSRRALGALDDRQLMDVGLSRADARRESALPFWRL